MRSRIAFAALTLAAVSVAFSADLLMRPGRWEATVQIVLPAGVPPGFPLAEPMTEIDCITAEDIEKLENPTWLLPDSSCVVAESAVSDNEIKFAATCTQGRDKMGFNYHLTMHSPDHWTGVATSHGRDPSQLLTMKLEGKRTGDACSAQELAEDQDE